jgi:hypothetical protein
MVPSEPHCYLTKDLDALLFLCGCFVATVKPFSDVALLLVSKVRDFYDASVTVTTPPKKKATPKKRKAASGEEDDDEDVKVVAAPKKAKSPAKPKKQPHPSEVRAESFGGLDSLRIVSNRKETILLLRVCAYFLSVASDKVTRFCVIKSF